MAAKGNVFTGARARFMIEGVKVGYARNCSGGESIEHTELEVLDNIEVQEHVPVRYRARFSASFFRIVGETAKSLGHFPANGANPEEHLRNILTQGSLTAAIEDSISGKLVATVEQVRAASNNWSIEAGSVVGRDMEFVCIRIRDESEG